MGISSLFIIFFQIIQKENNEEKFFLFQTNNKKALWKTPPDVCQLLSLQICRNVILAYMIVVMMIT